VDQNTAGPSVAIDEGVDRLELSMRDSRLGHCREIIGIAEKVSSALATDSSAASLAVRSSPRHGCRRDELKIANEFGRAFDRRCQPVSSS
jgi:hypothetical protein